MEVAKPLRIAVFSSVYDWTPSYSKGTGLEIETFPVIPKKEKSCLTGNSLIPVELFQEFPVATGD
jgi:hypothetical protein